MKVRDIVEMLLFLVIEELSGCHFLVIIRMNHE